MNTADIGIEEQTAAESLAHIERPYSVIVLDDNPMVLSMTKEMYAGIGVHCDTFTTIGDAMEAMRQHTYDLMITDMKMPEINGYEVLELLRSSSVSNSKEIPIVVATASGSCSEEELLENGFTACLFKPFSISELVAVSDKCLLTSTDKDELPDLSSLLAYGDKRAMLDRLITETERICRLSGKSWRGMTARRWTNGCTVSEVHGLLSVLTNPCGTCMNCCIKNLNVPKWNCGNAWMPCFVWEQLS